jgi:histidinol-phosphate aminotransferase
MLPELAHMPHLIIVRTLSKGFGLSGARIGYAIASPEIVAKLAERVLPWPIAHASAFAAVALLDRSSQVEARRSKVIAAREEFITSLRSIPGIVAYPSETNFVLVRVGDAVAVRDALLAKGIRVALGAPMSRFAPAQALLANTLRIAIPSPADMPVLMTALGELFTR